jgi:hypothetical protein
MRALSRAIELVSKYVDTARTTPITAAPEPDEPLRPVRAPRQQAIIELPGMVDPAGMRPAEISAQTDYSVTNTYGLLQALARSGITEIVPGGGPQRWRLTERHRHSAAVFGRLVAGVGPGEWTTCADISIASRGDTSAAWMVCWAAAQVPDFPHPHRVLLEGGALHPYGHDHNRVAPQQVRDDLVREGVTFSPDGLADPRQKVSWDQLRERNLRPAARPSSSEPTVPASMLGGLAAR